MIGALVLPGALLGQKNSCLECHSKLEDELKAPVEGFKLDIHQQFGLQLQGLPRRQPGQGRRGPGEG